MWDTPSRKSSESWLKTAKKPLQKELPTMVHDIAIAFVFLGLIITPALLAMRSGKEEKDVN
jgi:hypothetical protein